MKRFAASLVSLVLLSLSACGTSHSSSSDVAASDSCKHGTAARYCMTFTKPNPDTMTIRETATGISVEFDYSCLESRYENRAYVASKRYGTRVEVDIGLVAKDSFFCRNEPSKRGRVNVSIGDMKAGDQVTVNPGVTPNFVIVSESFQPEPNQTILSASSSASESLSGPGHIRPRRPFTKDF